MAKWTRKKIAPDANGEYPELNGGNEYTIDDDVAIEELNAIVNNSLYASDKVDTVIGEAEEIVEQGKTDISTQTEQGKTELNKIVDEAEVLVDKANTSINTVVGTANEALFQVQQVIASKGYYGSNPNLLINGDFRVNQRGWTSGFLASNKYCVDRWYSVNTLNTVTVNSNSITIKPGYQYRAFSQKIEDVTSLLGKTLTLSCKVSNVQDAKGDSLYLRAVRTYDISDPKNPLAHSTSAQITGDGIFKHTFTVEEDTLIFSVQIFTGNNADTEASLDLEYIKLEIGSVATPFSRRPYAEELALCQRYCQVLKSQGYRSLFKLATKSFYIPLPVTLRTHPTIYWGEGTGIQQVTGGSIDKTWTLEYVTPLKDNCIMIRATKEGATNDEAVLNLQDKTIIDAEMY